MTSLFNILGLGEAIKPKRWRPSFARVSVASALTFTATVAPAHIDDAADHKTNQSAKVEQTRLEPRQASRACAPAVALGVPCYKFAEHPGKVSTQAVSERVKDSSAVAGARSREPKSTATPPPLDVYEPETFVTYSGARHSEWHSKILDSSLGIRGPPRRLTKLPIMGS